MCNRLGPFASVAWPCDALVLLPMLFLIADTSEERRGVQELGTLIFRGPTLHATHVHQRSHALVPFVSAVFGGVLSMQRARRKESRTFKVISSVTVVVSPRSQRIWKLIETCFVWHAKHVLACAQMTKLHMWFCSRRTKKTNHAVPTLRTSP